MSGTWRLLVRGLLLEALFNRRGKQRGGLAWILAGSGRPLTGGPFNTNPVLAGYLIGWLRRGPEPGQQERIDPLAAAVAAVGDRLVWGLLRPVAVVISLLASAFGAIPAAAVLLLVYNPPELALRWRSVRRGSAGTEAILGDLGPGGLPRVAKVLARVGAVAAGALGGFWWTGELLAGRFLEALAGLCAAGLGWVLLRRRSGGIWTLPVGAILFGLAWSLFELFR